MQALTQCQRNETVCFGDIYLRPCCVSPVTYNSWYDLFMPMWLHRDGRLHVRHFPAWTPCPVLHAPGAALAPTRSETHSSEAPIRNPNPPYQVDFTEELDRDAAGVLGRITHFLRLPAHVYNTKVALNHHTHYDHSGRSGRSVDKGTVSSHVLCDTPEVLQRAQAVMQPGIKGLMLQLQQQGFKLPPEWWQPLRCNQSAAVAQPMTLAVMLAGLTRSFVEPLVWKSIGRGVRSLCPPPHCAPQLFFCPSDSPRAGSRPWRRAVDGLSEFLQLSNHDIHAVHIGVTGASKRRCILSGGAERFAMVKWRCHDEVGKREAIQGWAFNWVAMLRFDVAYFDPMPPLSSLPSGVIVPSNHGKDFGMSLSEGWLSDHLVVAGRAYSAHYFFHPCKNISEQLLKVPPNKWPAELALEAQLASSGAPVHLRFFPWVIVRSAEGGEWGRKQHVAECFRHTPCCVLPNIDRAWQRTSSATSDLLKLLDSSSARIDRCSSVRAQCPEDRLHTCKRMFRGADAITPCTTMAQCGRLLDRWARDACVQDMDVKHGQQHDTVKKKCSADRGPHYLAASRRQQLMETRGGEPRQPPEVLPSFLYFLSDDFRADDVTTALLSQLPMQHRIRFREAFPSAVVCVASRASFLTGRHPGVLGSLDNPTTLHWCKWDHPGSKPRSCPVLPAPTRSAFTTLPTVLRRAGWLTAGVGKIFHWDEDAEAYTVPYARNSAPLMRAVCRDAGPLIVSATNQTCARMKGGSRDLTHCACELKKGATWPDENIARLTIQRLDQFKRMGAPQQPFLLIAGFLRPHVPAHAPLRSLAAADAATAQLSSHRSVYPSRRLGTQARFYHGAAAFCVEQMSRVLRHLHASPMANTTAVIFHGDHGLGLGEWMGETGKWHTHLSDTTLRVPLLISVPWLPVDPHRVLEVRQPVSLLDVAPTILQLAGLEAVSRQLRLPGRSVMAQDHPGTALTQTVSAYTVRTRKWRYVRREPANASRWWSPCTRQVRSICEGAANSREPIELYRVADVEGGNVHAQNLATVPGMEAVLSGMERVLCQGDVDQKLCMKRCRSGRQTAVCDGRANMYKNRGLF